VRFTKAVQGTSVSLKSFSFFFGRSRYATKKNLKIVYNSIIFFNLKLQTQIHFIPSRLRCQNLKSMQISYRIRYRKTKTPPLYFEKQGFLCSGHGNLSVKVGAIIRISTKYHRLPFKVNFPVACPLEPHFAP
jgi:hypothetical protein